MNIPNNPAGRLLEIIKKGKSIANTAQAIDAWSTVLGTPKKYNSLLLKRIADVYAIPDEIENEIRDIEDANVPLLMEWKTNSNAAFANFNFNNSWHSVFKARFDDKVIYGLEFCNDLLSKQRPEKTVATEALRNLHEKVDELLGLIKEENIDQVTKDYIKERLVDIRRALDEVQISGIKAIEKEFQVVVGSLAINNNYNLQSENSESIKKFWAIIYRIALIVTILHGSMAISKDVIKALPAVYQPAIELVIDKNP